MKYTIFILLLAFLKGCNVQPAFCEFSVSKQDTEITEIHVNGSIIDLNYPYTAPDFAPILEDLNTYLEKNDSNASYGAMLYVDPDEVIHLNIWSTLYFNSIVFSDSTNQAFIVNCE